MTGDPLATLFFVVIFGVAIIAGVVALVFAYKYLSIKDQITKLARQEFEQWRARELATIKQENLELVRQEMRVELEQWKSEYEQTIRQDAINKSRAVTLGKITEHFIPYLPDFPYNPKDARFIGSPVDFVVFDGLDEGDLRKVVFVEVKTGSSSLSARERRIRDTIRSKSVEWVELRSSFRTPAPSAEVGTGQAES